MGHQKKNAGGAGDNGSMNPPAHTMCALAQKVSMGNHGRAFCNE